MHQDSSNSTAIINGISYNATALQYWNYTIYDNGTLSNGSECYLTFGNYRPVLVSVANGTFINSTSCYNPVNPIGTRGIIGLIFGSLFAVSIVISTINLRKHGRAYLPREKRWKPVGRRWLWYWTIFVAACGILSCFTAVDVDRDYIVNMPMVLQSFFLTLAIPTVLACVWEAVRSWASFEHRQIHDADPFAFRPTGAHAKLEFYLPLAFYAFDWMVFFLVVPRGWTFVQKQRSEVQTLLSARPAALDSRFKAGAILAIICLGISAFRLAYSSRVYHVRVPWALLQVVVLVAIRLAYMLAASWVWQISPYRLDVNIGWLYGLGYAPVLLVLCLLNARGYMNENEEKILIARRASRGEEDGLRLESRRQPPPNRLQQASSPAWWSRSRAAMSHGGQAFKTPTSPTPETVKAGTFPSALEANGDESGHSWWQSRKREEPDTRRRKFTAAPFDSGSSHAGGGRIRDTSVTQTQCRWTEEDDSRIRVVSRTRSSSESGDDRSSTISLQSRPQVVRSMLDV
ncbi:uncharacterized protein A1O9_00063 [Exophiala aquamarina CBS 119918]|uniref:Uncharacterized protein n=1 Tax=Exophiala aquamarina CBS 119918 TaxID=1182545 RepID=A0A072PQC8_9EURO|nr:uncharacterized protein A1O9_00063 [Exophiala aquamarina CBS 119918]KEF62091.1 hypothetical protein A1O9_00063 [Exophiala aquamarina CBS 119918]